MKTLKKKWKIWLAALSLLAGLCLLGAGTGIFARAADDGSASSLIELTVKKSWDGTINNEGDHPAVTVRLQKKTGVSESGEPVYTTLDVQAELNGDNHWEGHVYVPETDENGEKIEYRWIEDPIEGYRQIGYSSENNYTLITNAEIPIIELTVHKYWAGTINNEGVHPTVTVRLQKKTGVSESGEPEYTTVEGIWAELNGDNHWMAIVQVPATDENDEKIEYRWIEDPVEGYMQTEYSAKDTSVTITNTPVLEVRIQKVSADRQGEPLAGARLQLLDAMMNVIEEWDSKETPTSVGELLLGIEYTIRETAAPDCYVLTTDQKFTFDESGKLTTTASVSEDGVILIENELTRVMIAKTDVGSGDILAGAILQILDPDGNVVDEWYSLDEPHEIRGLRVGTEYTIRETVPPNGYVLTTDQKFTIDETGRVTTTASVTEDGVILIENQTTEVGFLKVDVETGEPLEDAQIQILDSEGEPVRAWTSGSEAYIVRGLTAGVEYTLHEVIAPAHYAVAKDTTFVINETGSVVTTGTVSETETGTVLLLIEDAPLIDVTLLWGWDDDDDRDGARPPQLETVLQKKTGTTEDGEPVYTDISGKTAILNADNHWSAILVDLPKYENGELVEYRWKEITVPDYEQTCTESAGLNGPVTSLTAKHEPEKIDIEVTKIWDDDNDRDGMRPDSFYLYLLLDNNPPQEWVEVTPNEKGEWIYTFQDMFKYRDHGIEINYSVMEEAVEGYTSSKDGFVITNTHLPEKITIAVTKVWNDGDDQEGLRPKKIVLHLLADGNEAVKVTFAPDDQGRWLGAFGDLPRYRDGGTEIVYSFSEDPVEGYTLSGVERKPVYDEEQNLAGYDATLYNQHDITPPPSGEDDHLALWTCLMAAATAGIAILGFVLRRKEERQ